MISPRMVLPIALLLVFLQGGGCATMISKIDDHHPSLKVYSGVLFAGFAFRDCILDLSSDYHAIGPLPEIGGTILFFDLPLSLAADTLILPLTIVEQTTLVGRLRSRLNAEEPLVRRWAINEVRDTWPVLTSLIPMLVESTEDPDPWVRQAALLALFELKRTPEFALEPLRRLLKDDRVANRMLAMHILGDMGAAARTSIPELLLARDRDPSQVVRSKAIEILRRLDPDTYPIPANFQQVSTYPDDILPPGY